MDERKVYLPAGIGYYFNTNQNMKVAKLIRLNQALLNFQFL
ncbi:MAG: hypothetical protein ABIX36_24115 [Mucilaginibacter sp.]